MGNRNSSLRSFRDLFGSLPNGPLLGESGPALSVAELDEVFVGPTLRSVLEHEHPNFTFISARGATGKSVLAKRLAATAQVPLWNLAADRGVSGDAFAARLTEYLGADGPGAFAESNDAFVIVDALDEARMRVSAQSWSEFLDSLASFAKGGHRFVLLGRERILEDVWVHFGDAGLACAWYEISHFDATQRAEYVDRHYEAGGGERTSAYEEARDAVLHALAGTVDASLSETFVGYAPVLDAVVALLTRDNPMRVINTFAEGMQAEDRVGVLTSVLTRLLDREQEKVAPTVREIGLEPGIAYSPSEQIEWLAGDLMGGATPSLEWCPFERRTEYVEKISAFLRDHPFRADKRWASPVFAAYVGSVVFGDVRVQKALGEIGRSTGLLFDFVTHEDCDRDVDEWQFAALHQSMLAAEWQDVTAEVAVVHPGAPTPVDELAAELYLAEGEGKDARGLEFTLSLDTPDEVQLHGPTAFLSVAFPGGTVVVDEHNGSATLGPDTYISCARLLVRGEAVEVARRSPGGDLEDTSSDATVVLELDSECELPGRLIGRVPLDMLELKVPQSLVLVYPWISYRRELPAASTAPDERARRFLNMLMKLLRRHGHDGPMAVFAKKLEGRQSIKQQELAAVLRELQSLGILQYDGTMIYLEPAWEKHWFDGRGRPGLPSLEEKDEAWAPAMQRISKILAS